MIGKIKSVCKNAKVRAGVVVGTAVMLTSGVAGAETLEGVMVTAFTGVKDEFVSAAIAIAPIALAIMGTFLAWRLVKRFFTSLARP